MRSAIDATNAPQRGSRRGFLKQGAACAATAALVGCTGDKVVNEAEIPARACSGIKQGVSDCEIKSSVNVVVIGAGPAGLMAAIQAAKLSAIPLLIEKSGVLGGTTVLNGVNLPGLFHAWGKQVIAGYGWDLVSRTVQETGDEMPDFTDFRRAHNLLQVRVDKAIYASLADDMLLRSGARLLLHTMVAEARPVEHGWKLTLATKQGLRHITAGVVIDCTGDANVAGLAGFERRVSPELQPGTLIMRTSGYDVESLDVPALKAAFDVAVTEGRLNPVDFGGATPDVFLRAHGDNAMHVVGIDGSTSEGKTKAELYARYAMLRIYRFMKAQPGLQDFRIDSFATECGIRETCTVVGEETVTAEDYVAGRVYDDAVCHSFYPIDLHRPSGDGIHQIFLKEGVVPTIPRGAMLPKGSRGFMVAGRCISGDQEAASAYRVQASCMAMGQAAGAIAALAARKRVTPGEVPLEDIRARLRDHGAIVPEPA